MNNVWKNYLIWSGIIQLIPENELIYSKCELTLYEFTSWLFVYSLQSLAIYSLLT